MLRISYSRDRSEGCWELCSKCDKLVSPPDGRFTVPLIVPASFSAHAGTSGDTPQTRTSWDSPQAELLQRLPGTQSEDISLQTTAVTAHEWPALHYAAQVWLPHEKHRWVQLLLPLQKCTIKYFYHVLIAYKLMLTFTSFLTCTSSSPWVRRRRWQHQFTVYSDRHGLQWTARGSLLFSADA